MPTLTVKPAPLAKKSVIVMSWPYKASWGLLNSLNNGCYIQSDHEQAPQATATVVLYSLAKLIEYKLGGTALDAVRGKFAQVEINSQKGHAILTLTTEPTFSAVRKVLTVASKNFTPAKLAPLYKKYAQLLGVRPETDHFNHAVSEMVKGAKTMQVHVTGTIRVPDGGVATLKAALDFVKPDDAGKGKAETENKSAVATPKWDELVIGSRLDAFICQQMLKTLQIESHVRDGNLIPITGSTKWDTVKAKVDADRIKRFVDLKLVKLGTKLPDAIRLMCASSGYFTAGDLDKLPASYTAAALTAILKKHF